VSAVFAFQFLAGWWDWVVEFAGAGCGVPSTVCCAVTFLGTFFQGFGDFSFEFFTVVATAEAAVGRTVVYWVFFCYAGEVRTADVA
jgi:hypothetical protein